MANQLFRCGTSIGANINEAQGAESKNDFKHKCKVAYKEAEETEYWLKLCKHAENYPLRKACLLTSNQSKEYWEKLFRQQILKIMRKNHGNDPQLICTSAHLKSAHQSSSAHLKFAYQSSAHLHI